MSRGQPKRPKLNVRAKPEEIAAMLAEFAPDDPFREVMPDGRGIDFMVPPPPWDDSTLEQIRDNLAILRVDPTHSNHEQMNSAIVRTIAGEFGFSDFIGAYVADLLLEWDHDTAETVFKDILRMKKQVEELPHRNHVAYVAYLDFLTEFGFQPTRQKLLRFIDEQPAKYPVLLNEPTTGKTWWKMLFDAGLSRLEE